MAVPKVKRFSRRREDHKSVSDFFVDFVGFLCFLSSLLLDFRTKARRSQSIKGNLFVSLVCFIGSLSWWAYPLTCNLKANKPTNKMLASNKCIG